jgi:LacI family transcriptional regulator
LSPEKMNSIKVTLSDVAREAKVSTASVDRVINSRNGVSARMRNHVLSVANRLGYTMPPPSELTTLVELDFVLPGGTNTYMNILAAELDNGASTFTNTRVRVHRIEGFSSQALSDRLESLVDQSDGIGMVGLDHPEVREAARQVQAGGVPLLTIASDIPNVPRLGYVGIDNRAAGRLAGYLLGRLMPRGEGKVALFAGSLSYRGHEEREMGFRHTLFEEFPELNVLQLHEILDDVDRCYTEARELIQDHPDLGGVYNIGAGNRGIAAALEESGRAKKIVFIGHELTPHTRRFLLSGTMDAVIDQNPRLEASESIRALADAARNQSVDRDRLAVGMQVIFRDNIPQH